MKNYVIGCDIGSQSLKTVLLSMEGEMVAEASQAYSIDFPNPSWADQPAQAWYNALCLSTRALLAQAGAHNDEILGIGLAAQVDGVVAIDKSGKPLRPAIIWMDRRAVRQCELVSQQVDPQRLFQISGLNLDASHVAPKIRWLRDVEPQIFKQSAYFLLAGSYLAYALTGELGVDYSNASSTLLMDVRTRQWSAELCEAFDVSADRLAPIYPATHILGRLTPKVAGDLGLSVNTRVILGSGDEHAACLGAGVAAPGLVCDIAGTAEPVCAAAALPAFDPTGLIETHCHAHPDLWLLENPGFVSGANYRWFRDQFAQAEVTQAAGQNISAYELLNEMAAGVQPGSQGLLLLPCLMGAMTPTWNGSARGVFYGFTLAHTRAHFARAVLEASAYAVRDLTDQMRAIGLSLQTLRVVGGGARSRLWRQIKADVTGLPVELPHTIETTALGAGMLALVGIGAFASLDEAASRVVQIVDTIDPEPKAQACYEEYYRLYRSVYAALEPVFAQGEKIK